MNMFKKVKADSTSSYMAFLSEDRRAAMQRVDQFIRKTVPKLKPHFSYNMLGYGSFKYLNSKKETMNWPVLGLASQKQHLSLYVCAMEDGKYIAEKYKKELGNAKVGKTWICFTRNLVQAGVQKSDLP